MPQNWPGTLPQCPALGWTQTPIPRFVEDSAEVGKPRRRNRFTRTRRTFGGLTYVRLTPTQRDAFWTFWETTLDGGVELVNLPHPDDGTTIQGMIVDPQTSRVSPGRYSLTFSFVEV